MSQNGCGCDGPVETKPFGEEIPDLKTLRLTLPSLQPLSAAHDWDYWPFGARCEREYYALEASGDLMQMDAYERAALQECMPSIRGLDGRQFELALKQYALSKAYRYAAPRMPAWFAKMCRTGALVPYVAGEEVAHAAAAPPSAPARRAPAAEPPRRRLPLPTAVALDDSDDSDEDEDIKVENLTEADYNKPGASMKEKDAILIAVMKACRKGVFGEALKDCDVPLSCVVAEGFPLGLLVKNRRKTFGRNNDFEADERLLKAGFLPVSPRSNAALADEAFKLHAPVLLDAAKQGLVAGATTEIVDALNWFKGRIRKVRPSDAAGNVYLDLAVKLGGLAPEHAKSGRWGTEVYWAHRIADEASAKLEGEDDEDDDEENEKAEAVSATPRPRPRRAAAGRAPAVVESSDDDEDVAEPPADDYEDDFDDEEDDNDAPAARQKRERVCAKPVGGDDDVTAMEPPKRLRRRTDEPDESDDEKEIDVMKLTEADRDPSASAKRKDMVLLAICRAIGAGEIPGLEDCDVRMDCVLPCGYRFGYHVALRRATFGSDPYADQELLDAGFVRVSARSKAAMADDALRRHVPVLRAAAADGLGACATPELRKAVNWLRMYNIRTQHPSDAVDDAVLNLALELGSAAPAGAKSGQGRCYWAHCIAAQARAVLAGEDTARVVTDEMFEGHKRVLLDAAARGLGSKATAEIKRGVRWLRGRLEWLAEKKSRASSVAADDVYLELAKELGDAAPAGAKSANGKGYWAHGIAAQARAVLAAEDAAPRVPKKRKRAAAAPAKPVKKPSRRRR